MPFLRHTRWLLGLGVACAAGAGCTETDSDEVRSAARGYASSVVTRDVEKICELSSAAFRREITGSVDSGTEGAEDERCREAWVARMRNEGGEITEAFGGFHIKGLRFAEPEKAEVKGSNAKEKELELTLVRESGDWVVEKTSLPLPGS